MFFRRKAVGGRTYLQIVESRRDGSFIRQHVVATLGRTDARQRRSKPLLESMRLWLEQRSSTPLVSGSRTKAKLGAMPKKVSWF